MWGIKGRCAVDFLGLNVSCIVGLDSFASQDPHQSSVFILAG